VIDEYTETGGGILAIKGTTIRSANGRSPVDITHLVVRMVPRTGCKLILLYLS
jgi:hypothetical protein